MRTLIYIFFILVLTACSDKRPGIEPPSAIWPYEFYNKFNLRTIVSSYGLPLRYYCASYPKDFFRPDKVVMPNTDKVVIQDEKRLLSFEIISQNQIIVVDEVKDGSYQAKHLYTIYYNEEHDDYRADLFFIQEKEDCAALILKDDENVSQ